ncbi:MAG: hypothetical protein H3C48_10195 [Chitinophagaceae bacterium]|nr:hypothetical protein [Chitinophagaceae bacterium]
MIALITGDLVNSVQVSPKEWMPVLTRFLNKQGRSPKAWEIFRGDSFQFRCSPAAAFKKFLVLKSLIKQIAGLDIRVSIGVGTMEYAAERISASNGTAFLHSGRAFDNMKDKQYLVFGTGDEKTDLTLNLFARFASLVMDNWSTSVAETVQVFLEKPDWNQQQVAEKLKINQSAVSQNRRRAQLDLLLELDNYYSTCITALMK